MSKNQDALTETVELNRITINPERLSVKLFDSQAPSPSTALEQIEALISKWVTDELIKTTKEFLKKHSPEEVERDNQWRKIVRGNAFALHEGGTEKPLSLSEADFPAGYKLTDPQALAIATIGKVARQYGGVENFGKLVKNGSPETKERILKEIEKTLNSPDRSSTPPF